MKHTIHYVLCFPLLITLASLSDASNLYDYPIIDPTKGHHLSHAPNKPINVILFYGPDCLWCLKQTKVFNEYLSECGTDIQFTGIGVNGKRQQIKKEAWLHKANFPMYMASRELLKATGKVDATPLTIMMDEQGEIVAHVKGYIGSDKWRIFVADSSDIEPRCTAQG